jgi:hypothetical protein
VVEYINVQTQGEWQKALHRHRWRQYLLGSILGAVPGCLGAFTVVSLYSHQVLSFGALVAAMIATSGDEAFVMFSLFPGTALLITAILAITGIAVGSLADAVYKRQYGLIAHLNHQLPIHEADVCNCFQKDQILRQLKYPTFPRALLIGIFLTLLLIVLTGAGGIGAWEWKRVTFAASGLAGLFIVSTVPDHFLEEHFWEHLLKKHAPRIFMWTFGALLVIHLLGRYVNVESWIQHNHLLVLLIAVAIGIIPESGPHLIFVTLYASGALPLSILLASSITQDGHGMLPMLAVSRRGFVYVKALNLLTGLIIGLAGLLLGS